jgi:hypothetical protein
VVYHDWRVRAKAADQSQVEIVLDDSGRLIFGTCGCGFFKEHLLNKGPCEHMIAVLAASQPLRRDLPSSRQTAEEPIPRSPRPGDAAEATEESELDTEADDGDNEQ